MPTKLLTASLIAALLSGTATLALAQKNPVVGGAAMPATNDIVSSAVNLADHTTRVASGLAETLSGLGPCTEFGPVNAALAALPAGTVDTLPLPANKERLTKVLTAHVVLGTLTAEALAAQADADDMVNLQTVSGAALTVQVRPSGAAYGFDETGNAFQVTIPDVMQSNGVIHVVEGVLLPR